MDDRAKGAARSLSRDEWADIMARFVQKLGSAVHETYEELFHDSDDVSTPVRAEPLASMLCDGVMALLSAFNALNAKEVESVPGIEKFDIIELFTQEMFSRLSAQGYTTLIDETLDPEAFQKATEAMDEASKPPDGSTKH